MTLSAKLGILNISKHKCYSLIIFENKTNILLYLEKK